MNINLKRIMLFQVVEPLNDYLLRHEKNIHKVVTKIKNELQEQTIFYTCF